MSLLEKKAEVQAFVDTYNRAMVESDLKTLSGIIAHDEALSNFGTDAGEYWLGWEQFKTALEHQFEAAKITAIKTKDLVIRVSPAGDAALVSGNWELFMSVDGKEATVSGMRVSMVLEKKDGQWLLVHSHASMPYAGQVVKK